MDKEQEAFEEGLNLTIDEENKAKKAFEELWKYPECGVNLSKNKKGYYIKFKTDFKWQSFRDGWFNCFKECQKFDPWNLVPDKPIHGEIERNLIVVEDGGWGIVVSIGTRHKNVYTLAMGYNADFAKNGETKILKDGKWIYG